MGLFALPVPNYRLGIHSRPGNKKADEDEDNAVSGPEWDTPSHLPSDSINPLSHPPDTLRQFAVAGLSPEDEVPSKIHPLFPHKQLPSGSGRRQGARHDSVATAATALESEDDRTVAKTQDKSTTVKQLTERLKHLSTMTAIMHRCLNDGDIARAKRAFGLIVQSKFVDIRLGGLWAVGSEILLRDGEGDEEQKRQQQQQQQSSLPSSPPLPQQQQSAVTENERGGMRRWGSAANMDKVRFYFENLIQQHPHDPLRPHLTSALDFWPALFGVEIYNLDAEFRSAVRRLEASLPEENEDSFMADDDDDAMGMGVDADMGMDSDVDMADPDEAFEARRRQREQGKKRLEWAARDDLRSETMSAAERIARQMDATMENKPYATHRGLLWLRANLALFIGDLYIPSRLLAEEHGEESEDQLRARTESIEERGALDRRKEEHIRARMLFRKILDGRGELDGWALKFLNAGEEDEPDVSVEDGW